MSKPMPSSEYCMDRSEDLLRLAAAAEDAALRAACIAQARKWLGSALVSAFEEEVEATDLRI